MSNVDKIKNLYLYIIFIAFNEKTLLGNVFLLGVTNSFI